MSLLLNVVQHFVRRRCPIRGSCGRPAKLLWLVGLTLVFTDLQLQAGGGPENVLLVVNSRRSDSLTIGNHYAELRQIPTSNILYLEWQGSMETVDVETFRQRFLEPIFAEIDRRRLQKQIDYIVYSSGFPYSVTFTKDFDPAPAKETGPRGSLTGMTYLSQLVRRRDRRYGFSATQTSTNNYYGSETHGFRTAYEWTSQGQPAPTGGESYYLSAMLGYTDGRGNTVEEIVHYLRRAALADGNRPPGTIYLMRVPNEVRSQTRDAVFPQIATILQQEGVHAEVLDGDLPTGRDDVAGLTTGRADLPLDRVGLKLRPGAICDNLTSFGGDLRDTAHQTPVSDFLRYGAAGASGTVVEPFALQAKFPHPIVHVHYTRGASLAEAFYQSVASPYQLLIVGDPLCRPWARIPQIAVDGVTANQSVQAMLTLRPRSLTLPVKGFQLFVDGRHIQDCRPDGLFEVDTTKVGDGFHELRIVGIEDSQVESQGRLIIPIQVANHDRRIDAAIQPKVVDPRGQVECYLSAPGSRVIYLFHNRRTLGVVKGEQGTVVVNADSLGQGPITLTAVGLGATASDKIFSKPLSLTVQESSAVSQYRVETR